MLNFPWLMVVLITLVNVNSFILLHGSTAAQQTFFIASQYQESTMSGNSTLPEVEMAGLLKQVHGELVLLLSVNLFTLYFFLPTVLVFTVHQVCQGS